MAFFAFLLFPANACFTRVQPTRSLRSLVGERAELNWLFFWTGLQGSRAPGG